MPFDTATGVGIFVGLGLLIAGVGMWVMRDRKMMGLQTSLMSLTAPPAVIYSSRFSGNSRGGRRSY